ncbi:MAG: Rid family detoxifying hydrolase [Bacteroidia bacterium]|nr:Rid family detoxifying hydrolase [Bacteroidia bacterium]
MQILKFLLISSLFLLLSCQQTAVNQDKPTKVEYFAPPSSGAEKIPYSEVVKAGNTLYLAGKIGRKPGEPEVVPGGIEAETRQSLENIQVILSKHGATMDDVVKCTVFLTDINEWGRMNEVYKTFFEEHFPARSAVGVDALAKGARVEIECIAVLP